MKTKKIYSQVTTCLLLLLIPLLSGCLSSQDRALTDARRYSAVSRSDPSFRPSRGAQLIWYSGLIVQAEGVSTEITAQQIAIVENTIEAQLLRKGYRFTTDSGAADYMIAAALLMDDSTRSQEISDLVQIYPGLSSAFDDLEQGTLLVVVTPPTDPATAILLWRGAIQAYAVDETFDEATRAARLRSLVVSLMSAIPDPDY